MSEFDYMKLTEQEKVWCDNIQVIGYCLDNHHSNVFDKLAEIELYLNEMTGLMEEIPILSPAYQLVSETFDTFLTARNGLMGINYPGGLTNGL